MFLLLDDLSRYIAEKVHARAVQNVNSHAKKPRESVLYYQIRQIFCEQLMNFLISFSLNPTALIGDRLPDESSPDEYIGSPSDLPKEFNIVLMHLLGNNQNEKVVKSIVDSVSLVCCDPALRYMAAPLYAKLGLLASPVNYYPAPVWAVLYYSAYTRLHIDQMIGNGGNISYILFGESLIGVMGRNTRNGYCPILDSVTARPVPRRKKKRKTNATEGGDKGSEAVDHGEIGGRDKPFSTRQFKKQTKWLRFEPSVLKLEEVSSFIFRSQTSDCDPGEIEGLLDKIGELKSISAGIVKVAKGEFDNIW